MPKSVDEILRKIQDKTGRYGDTFYIKEIAQAKKELREAVMGALKKDYAFIDGKDEFMRGMLAGELKARDEDKAALTKLFSEDI